MTIEDENFRSEYSGDGSTLPFTFNFKILDESDLKVVLSTSAGVETTQVISSDYTVSGVGDQGGGTVAMVVAPALGEKLAIILDSELKQTLDLNNTGAFPSQSVEDALDRTINITKRDRDLINRSLGLSEGSVDGSGRYEAGGNLIANLGSPRPGVTTDAPDQAWVNAAIVAITGGSFTGVVTTFSASLLDELTAAAWLDTLVPDQTAYDDWLDTLLYDHAGASAVPRSVRSRLQSQVWAEDFGASPSASAAVNVAAFNAAIVAVNASGGGVVNVGPGTFNVDSSGGSAAIQILSNVWFRGCGVGATTIALANNQDSHVFNANVGFNANICISDIEVDGNRANQAGTSQGVRLDDGASDVRLFNLYVHDTYNEGIGLNATATSFARVWIDSVHIKDVGDSGIRIDDPQTSNEAIFISNVRIDQIGLIAVTAQAGIYVRGIVTMSNISVVNLNHATLAHAGVRFDNASAASPNESDAHFSTLTGFYVEGSGASALGIYCFGRRCVVSTGTITLSGASSVAILVDSSVAERDGIENDFSSIIIEDVGGTAIWLASDARRNRMSGIQVLGAGGIGIRIQSANDNVIDGLQIVDSVSDGVRVETGSTGNIIRGNTIKGSGGIGVNVLSGAVDTVVQGNTYEGNTGVNLVDAATNTIISGDTRHNVATPESVASVAGSISLPYPGEFFFITGTAIITSIDAASSIKGRRITLAFQTTASMLDGSNLLLATHFVPLSGNSTITLICDGTNWYEASRSLN